MAFATNSTETFSTETQSFTTGIVSIDDESEPTQEDGTVEDGSQSWSFLNTGVSYSNSFRHTHGSDDTVEDDGTVKDEEMQDETEVLNLSLAELKQYVHATIAHKAQNWNLPRVTTMRDFEEIPHGSTYVIPGTKDDTPVIMMDDVSPESLEGPSYLYEDSYEEVWILGTGDIASQDFEPDKPLMSCRPRWLKYDTISHLRSYGEVSIRILETARTKEGSKRMYRLSTVKNESVAMSLLMANSLSGISTIFVFVDMRVKEGLMQKFESFIRDLRMSICKRSERHLLF